MDYEKRYKDALEKARKLISYPTTQPFVSDLEDIFPELAESEDERIRKWCISHFRECFRISGDNAEYQEFLNNKVVPWLEKQGEQKPIVTPKFRVGDIITDGKDFPRCTIEEIDEQVYYCDYTNIDIVDADKNWKLVEHKPADKVEPKFKAGDKIISTISNISYYITEVWNGHYLTDVGCVIMFNAQDNFELVEQKPAWSEEDEKQARQIERIVHDDGCTQKLQKQIADWFKSLKERCNWKPSDEQMNTLEQWLKDNQYKGDARYCYSIFESLYQDLKKLKG